MIQRNEHECAACLCHLMGRDAKKNWTNTAQKAATNDETRLNSSASALQTKEFTHKLRMSNNNPYRTKRKSTFHEQTNKHAKTPPEEDSKISLEEESKISASKSQRYTSVEIITLHVNNSDDSSDVHRCLS